MPFFVVSRRRRPSRGPFVPGPHNEFVLLAGVSADHTTRADAERELARLQESQPDHEHAVIEAASSAEASIRAQSPAATFCR